MKIYEMNAQSIKDQGANTYSLDFSQIENTDTYTSLLNVYKEVLRFVDFGSIVKRLGGKSN